MTLTELRYIIAVAQERHFGRAAASCNVSQPSLSVAVKKLEEELEVKIFERRSSDVTLTPIGVLIIEQAQRVLEDAMQIKECAQQGKDPLSGVFRLGVIYTIAPYLLPGLVSVMHEKAPSMPLILGENFTSILLEELKNGQIDCACLALPINQPGLMIQPLYDEDFVAAVPTHHALASQQFVTKNDLKRSPVLLLGSGHCFRDQILDFCSDLNRGDVSGKNHTVEGTSLQTIMHMVAQGLGITILPASCAPYYRDNPTVRIIPFDPQAVPRRRVALVWRRSFPRQAAIDAIKEGVSRLTINGCKLLTGLPAIAA